MNRTLFGSALLALWALTASSASAIITNVVETGGFAEATDTITAKWTGTTWNVTQANEPFVGAVVGNPYTVGTFGHNANAFVDRNHRYVDDNTATAVNKTIPAYLVGGDYIMGGNDNRDRPALKMDVTVNTPVNVYLLIDNRLSDGANGTPPTFDATHMQWVLDQAWIPTNGGLNRTGLATTPDEVAFDENGDGSVQQWMSVYKKVFPIGTFTLLQADNPANNMYGVVVTTAAQFGDVDLDNDVDMIDFGFIRDNFRKTVASRALGDLDGNGRVDFKDYRQWKTNFPFPVGDAVLGVPEPATGAMGLLAAIVMTGVSRARARRARP